MTSSHHSRQQSYYALPGDPLPVPSIVQGPQQYTYPQETYPAVSQYVLPQSMHPGVSQMPAQGQQALSNSYYYYPNTSTIPYPIIHPNAGVQNNIYSQPLLDEEEANMFASFLNSLDSELTVTADSALPALQDPDQSSDGQATKKKKRTKKAKSYESHNYVEIQPVPSSTSAAPPPELLKMYPANNKSVLSESQKRSNHILSEQKRRNAIRSGYQDLVDLLKAGENISGIVLTQPYESDDEETRKRKKKGKGKAKSGRGRGRRGEVGAGASKSVVLERAAHYILWMERGNAALKKEIDRVHSYLGVVEPAAP